MTNYDLAWNGRFIVTQDGHVDLPHDRQGVEGSDDPKERVEFLDALSAAVPSRSLVAAIASKLRSGEIRTRESEEVVLVEGNHGGAHWLVTGNSNASAGYFYVKARRVEVAS